MSRGIWGAMQGAGEGVSAVSQYLFEDIRQKKLEEYRAKESEKDRAFRQGEADKDRLQQSTERQLDRDQDQAQFETSEQRARDRDSFEMSRAAAGDLRDADRFAMQKQEHEQNLERIRLQIEEGQMDIEDRREANRLLGILNNPDSSAEEQLAAYDALQVYQDPTGKRFISQRVTSPDGEETVLVLDPQRDRLRGNVDAGQAGEGPLSQPLVEFARSSRIPEAAIQEFMADPSEQAMEEFDGEYGPGSAQRLMDVIRGSNTGTQPSATSPAETVQQAQADSGTSPPKELSQQEVDELRYVPDGYTRMTSGNYVLSGESSDWDRGAGSFTREKPFSQQEKDREREIYRSLNPDWRTRFDADAAKQAKEQVLSER